VVRTNELSASLPQLAGFIGVALDTLRSDLRHVHRGTRSYHALRDLDDDMLQSAYTAADCAPLMQRFFPETASALP
jgi:hypothetical protein